ncbi:hypothetical protein ACEZCY_13335 [Streptacidiphilus sp. N1-12]|uniref:Uncharacterized protein n=2 Tax=Streptacidiphilus alkalitolerans TaxID=3342712 RepID=A0ABV6WDV1_9ACTN
MSMSDRGRVEGLRQPLLTQDEIDLYRQVADLQTLDTAWRSLGAVRRQAFGYTTPDPPHFSAEDPRVLRLLTLGLLAEDPSQPGGYRLIEPVALEPALVHSAREQALARQVKAVTDLATAQQHADVLAELQAAYVHGRRESNEGNREYLTGIEAINDLLDQLISHASRELLTAQPGRRRASALKLGFNSDIAALDRGMTLRTLYMQQSVSDPESIREYVEAAASRGAQFRVVDTPIPFLRMICIDRTWLVTEARDPEQAEHDPRTHTAQALVTRDPATVAAFIHNFERDWAQARPLALLPPAEQRNPIQQAVINALKTGADHETIAKQLNITSRTVTKHATAHRAALGAAPGFQHGYLTGRQEILDQQRNDAPH